MESTGIRIFAAGNIHTASATLYTHPAGQRRQRPDLARGRTSGFAARAWTTSSSPMPKPAGPAASRFAPLPQDPFLLQTTDGGKTWRPHAIFNEPRFGSIQQFYFEDKKNGALIIDHGPGSSDDRYELYETNDGGETWNIQETSVKAIRLKRAPVAPSRMAGARRWPHQELPPGTSPGTDDGPRWPHSRESGRL